MNKYIGNESQLFGVEEYTLIGGYKDGVRMLRVYNPVGLMMTINLDRNADIVSLTYKGKNISYITPNGIRHHHLYEREGDGWIKHFTAGFLTTCGYENVGVPCVDDGVNYHLHGSIAYVPVDSYSYEVSENKIIIKCTVLDESIFSYKIKRVRTFVVSLNTANFTIEDEFVNRGGEETPVMILYHMNIGYPLLNEDTTLSINYDKVVARNDYSNEHIKTALNFQKPTPGFLERVYFYNIKDEVAKIEVSSAKEQFKLSLNYSTKDLPFFTEWKLMGVRDYVLGIEPGNVTPEGRTINKEKGRLVYLKPDEKLNYKLNISIEDL